jgi:small subunit ribosomal protein S21
MQLEKQIRKLQEIAPGNLYGVSVVGGIDSALREFKRMIKKSGILTEVYARKEYEKPSITKRRTKKNAQYKQRRQNEESI